MKYLLLAVLACGLFCFGCGDDDGGGGGGGGGGDGDTDTDTDTDTDADTDTDSDTDTDADTDGFCDQYAGNKPEAEAFAFWDGTYTMAPFLAGDCLDSGNISFLGDSTYTLDIDGSAMSFTITHEGGSYSQS